jgi:putative redox protein
MTVEIKRVNNAFHMQAVGNSEFKINIDGSPSIGGVNAGARPMELILMGLGSCSAIDVIQILKKQKQTVEDFKISIDAERVQDQVPSVFKSIVVTFIVSGQVEETKLQRAIELSKDKYCSVSAMLHQSVDISYNYQLNN